MELNLSKMLSRFIPIGILSVVLAACSPIQTTPDIPEPMQPSSNVSTMQLYALKDDLYDSDAFRQFRNHPDNINALGNFYNLLSSSPDLKVLSYFTQAVPVKDFTGDSKFYYHSEEFMKENQQYMTDISIKSLQINQAAFEFYNLKTQSQNTFDWAQIEYTNGQPVPIILGSSYQELYAIGDIIEAKFYFKDISFQVFDFLKPDSSFIGNNGVEINLNEYLVIPYPSQCWQVDDTNFEFEGILYFAMINSKLQSSLNEENLLQEIKHISDETGFSAFSVIKLDTPQPPQN